MPTCTITKSGRCDEYGRPLSIGSTYTGTVDQILALVQSGYAVPTVSTSFLPDVYDQNEPPNFSNSEYAKKYPPSVFRVSSGAGDHEIMAAQQWIIDRFERGVIELDPFGRYTIGDTVRVETSVIGVRGNRAIWDAPNLSAGQFALWLDNTKNGDVGAGNGFGRYGGPMEVADLEIRGNSTTARDYAANAVRVHSATTGASVLVSLRNFRTTNFGTGISIGSRAYFLRGYHVSIGGSMFALIQEAGATDYSEDVAFFGGTFFNSDCLVKTLAGQQLRFFGVSFDYFGDKTGTRVTADDRAFDIQAGGLVELERCHVEFDYGHSVGQTNSPVRLAGANSRFIMNGGFFGSLNTTQQPLYETPISTDNASQVFVMRDVRMSNMGRKSQVTKDDQLVAGSVADNASGSIARVNIDNLIPMNYSRDDLPSVPSYVSGASLFRNGVDAPHTELSIRTSVTGTAAIASTGTTDGAVTARNNTGGMMKITGQGKVNITIPSLRADRRTAWALFLNASQAVGTITVKQRDCTAVFKWDGAGALTATQDTRNSYSSATKTITAGGTNQFERVSWKDVHSDAGWSPRMGGPVFAIEIDTTAMSSGSLYLDDIAFAQM